MEHDFLRLFIIGQMVAPDVNQNISQSWPAYYKAVQTVRPDLNLKDQPDHFLAAHLRSVGKKLNVEFGRDVIAYHFPGIRRHAGGKWDSGL